jgi:hypothetical protein
MLLPGGADDAAERYSLLVFSGRHVKLPPKKQVSTGPLALEAIDLTSSGDGISW